MVSDKSRLFLVVFFSTLLFLMPSTVLAKKQPVCVANASGKVFTKRRCGKAAEGLFRSNAAELLDIEAAEGDNGCSACGTDMSGDWSYTRIDNNNGFVYQKNITLVQTDADFMGSNESHTMVGNVKGKWVRLTLTVSGEEGEGWVLFAEGSLFQVGNFLLGTLAVPADTFGEGGSLILRKNLAP